MRDGAAIFSLVRPFLPIIGTFVGVAILVEGLLLEFVPSAVGFSSSGAPITGSRSSPYDILLIVIGLAVIAASSFAARHVYHKHDTAKIVQTNATTL